MEEELARYQAAKALLDQCPISREQLTEEKAALYQRLAEEPPFAVLCFKNWSVLMQWNQLSGLTPTQQNLFYQFDQWEIS